MAGQRAGASTADAGRRGGDSTSSHGTHTPSTGGRAAARRARQGGHGRSSGDGTGEGSSPGGPGGPGRRGGRAAGRGGKKKRGRTKLVAWVVAGALGLIVATGGVIYWQLNGNISSFDGDGISKDRPPAPTADASGHVQQNILLIGSDSRGGNNRDLGGGGDDGARSDTTILLHVYADHKHAVGISIPRDSLVDIPSCKLPNGTWTKAQTNVMFNSAFSVGNSNQGNPACTQNTVEKLTNIRIDHTIVVNFQGFAAITSAVDGVDVCLPNAVYEGDINPNLGHKGKQILTKGPQKVSGQTALDYVRIRHGIGDGSDIGRMKRQQAFLASLIKQIKTKGMDPTTLVPLADAATKSLLVDPGLDSAAKLTDFAMSMKGIDLHDIKFVTVPWKFEGARVGWVHPDVDQLWASLRADKTLDGQDASGGANAGQGPNAGASGAPATPAAPAPIAQPPAAGTVKGAGIKVAVYNGTTTAGLTTKAAAALEAAQFTVTGKSNASTQNHATTVVQYGPGEKASAETVAALFPGATLEPGGKGIGLILGKDYATSGGGTGSPAASVPAEAPSSAAKDARSADDDPCSNLTFG